MFFMRPAAMVALTGALAAMATAVLLPISMRHESSEPPAVLGRAAQDSDEPASREAVPLPGAWTAVANGDRVRDLLSEEGTLWVAAEGGGVLRWNLESGAHVQFLAPQDGLPANDARALARDRSGRLWVATAKGLAWFDDADERWRAVAAPPALGNSATALARAPDGALWVGFEQVWDSGAAGPAGTRGAFVGGGLGRYNPVAGAWLETWQAEEQAGGWVDLPSNNVTALAVGSDGLLWSGTRPFFNWRADQCPAPPCSGAWSRRGGGLAAYDRLNGRWARWGDSDADTCLVDTIHDLAPGAAGHMWVATRGTGLQVFRAGLDTVACGAGHSAYKRVVGGQPLPGTKVWAVAVAEDGRVYSGVGPDRGQGIAVLDHGGNFDEVDADGRWELIGLDDIQGQVEPLVSALAVGSAGLMAGTVDSRDDRQADGYGIKWRRPDGTWRSFKTAATGLASNRISAVAQRPGSLEVWFGTEGRGLSRWDGQSWTSWRALERHELAARLAVTNPARTGELILDIGLAAYQAAFPEPRSPARLGEDDPVVYELYAPETVAEGLRVRVHPPPEATLPPGLPVYTTTRGPAGDRVTDLAFDAQGRLWLSAWPSLAKRANPRFGEIECDDVVGNAVPDCDWDGGLSVFESGSWQSLDPAPNGLPSRQAQAVAVDRAGQVWVGTGAAFGSGGRGAAVLDPGSGTWTRHNRALSGAGFGFDNVSGIDVDPVTGQVWLVSQGRPICPTPSGGRGDCPAIQGAVSRWDGQVWQSWSRRGNPPATGLADQGGLEAIRFDRSRGRVWVGGWEGERNFHWNEGLGLNASVDACPRACPDGVWSGQRFADDGTIRALAVDGSGRLWAGGHRNRAGLVPPLSGLKLLTGETWTEHNTDTTALPSNYITALDAQGLTVWVGTLDRGAVRWRPAVLDERAYLPQAGR